MKRIIASDWNTFPTTQSVVIVSLGEKKINKLEARVKEDDLDGPK
jgi:hypothetical protein